MMRELESWRERPLCATRQSASARASLETRDHGKGRDGVPRAWAWSGHGEREEWSGLKSIGARSSEKPRRRPPTGWLAPPRDTNHSPVLGRHAAGPTVTVDAWASYTEQKAAQRRNARPVAAAAAGLGAAGGDGQSGAREGQGDCAGRAGGDEASPALHVPWRRDGNEKWRERE